MPSSGEPQLRPRSKRRSRPPPARRHREAIVEEITLPGEVDSHALEALRLEIRRLGRRLGVEIQELRIVMVEKGRSR